MIFKEDEIVTVVLPIGDAKFVIGMNGIVIEGDEYSTNCDFSMSGHEHKGWWVPTSALELYIEDITEDALFWRKVRMNEIMNRTEE